MSLNPDHSGQHRWWHILWKWACLKWCDSVPYASCVVHRCVVFGSTEALTTAARALEPFGSPQSQRFISPVYVEFPALVTCLAQCSAPFRSPAHVAPCRVPNLTSVRIVLLLKNAPKWVLQVQLKIRLFYGFRSRNICVKSMSGHQEPWLKMGYTASGSLPCIWKLAGTSYWTEQVCLVDMS